MVAVGSWAAPTAAHDELRSSSPAEDQDVAAAPSEVVLTFRGNPMGLGATVIVADAAGDDWSDGEPAVADHDVSVPIRAGMPDGHYQVRWRVISADGAVVSGFYDFAVGDAEGAPEVELPAPEAAGAAEGGGDFDLDEQAVSTGSGSTTTATAAPGTSPARTAAVAVGGAVAALALVVLYRTLDSFRRSAPSDPTRSQPQENP